MSLTAAQQRAVAARGNVLVMAGAGTGKTSTLVARCLDCLGGDDPASLDELLIVTFTEAAAAEARERIRAALEEQLLATGAEHWAQQLALFDTAHLGTLHGFCFQLVREHFYQLGLDPQVSVLEAAPATMMADETLAELLDDHYAGRLPESAQVLRLIETYGNGRDDAIRALVRRLHAYSQTRADAADWLERQLEMFATAEPRQWQEWLLAGIADWRDTWLPDLASLAGGNPKAKQCGELLAAVSPAFTREQAAAVVEKIVAAGAGPWPPRRKVELRKPLEDFFTEAGFLHELAPTSAPDPLAEDWNWSREAMLALLRLTREFGARYRDRKRADGVVDFHDLEQLSLELLWDRASHRPSAIAEHWRAKLRFVFVDEYQDINAAQDRILAALSRDGTPANRFLVGDVKQSIYRFRLADPGIFRRYAREWQGKSGQVIALGENFRSRPGILEFVNAVFAVLMQPEVGGVVYDEAAKLVPAMLDATRNPQPASPDVELLIRLSARAAPAGSDPDAMDDLQSAEKEARHVALRLRELRAGSFTITDRETKQPRSLEWRDMAVLLRAPATKAEGYAKQFEQLGVPLEVMRGGFYESLEVADLLNLLRLLDNPLQDVPLLAVLRSPLVALTLDELATIRLAARGHFWTALVRSREVLPRAGRVQQEDSPPATFDATRSTQPAASLLTKVDLFLTRFTRWRKLARQASLSTCLEEILAETHYADWLLAQERGAQRHANVQRLFGLAAQFDQFQRQGLFRFLRFIEAQQEAGVEPEATPASAANAVRLMSVHQSKGLEFPVVVVADLGRIFNERDLRAEIVLDEEYGLCPRVRPPRGGASYPSLAHWLARQRQKRELLGEELRLLYVAMTRARDKLILAGTMTRTKWDSLPARWPRPTPRAIASARSAAEWLRLWLAQTDAAARNLFSYRELADEDLRAETDAMPPTTADAVPSANLDEETLARLRVRLTWSYPHEPATARAAKTSVTALRRQATEELEDEAARLFRPRPAAAARLKPSGKLSAVEVGNAHHKFLEHLALDSADSRAALRAEAERMRTERRLADAEIAALDFAALETFWQSEVGSEIRANAAHVRRELEFTARFAAAELDELTATASGVGAEEFVVVQGATDLVVLRPEELWLLDFKTDVLAPDEVAAKVKFYAPQLQLYALALARIHARPVTRAWLHFLTVGQTQRVELALGARAAGQASCP